MKKNCCIGEAGDLVKVTGVRVGRVGEEEYVKSMVTLRESLQQFKREALSKNIMASVGGSYHMKALRLVA